MCTRTGRTAILLFLRSGVAPASCTKIKEYYYPIRHIINRKFSSSNNPYQLKMDVFEGVEDNYNGITVDSKTESSNTQDIEHKIDESLKRWHAEKRRCIWFRIYIQDAAWVPLLAKKGFTFHHARDGFVMMCKWLPTDSEANLPPASHTNLGVGGLVINDKDQVLVVSEKHYKYPHWKLPGGYVERGEDMVDAAIREVKEETGVDTIFYSVITFRHTHQMMFGNSDIYVIIMLKPLNQEIHVEEREINKCKWMDIEEYLHHPNVHEFNRSIVRIALDYKLRGIKIKAEKNSYTFGKKENPVTRNMTLMAVTDAQD